MSLTSDFPPSVVTARSLALELGQGGGEPGELGVIGTVAHGNTVTLIDPQGRLGSRSNSVFRHWQQGSQIILNGTATSVESGAAVPDTTTVWGGVSDNVSIVSDDLRHGNIDQQYRALGKGSTVNAKAFDEILDDPKFYFAKWVNPGAQFNRVYVLGYTGLTGSFFTHPKRTRGEAVTLSLVGGGSKTGYITSIINSVMTLEITGGAGAGGAADIEGATVTGVDSGASVVIDTSIYGVAGSAKVVRIYSGGVPNGQGISVITSHNGGLIDLDEYGLSGYVGSLVNDFSGRYYSIEPERWHLYELEIDFSGETGVVRQRIDNGEIYTVSGIDKANMSSVRGFFLANVGLDTAGLGVGVGEIGISEDWGEIVADNDLKRLVIGDAPVLSDCSHVELQNHTDWTAGEVPFVVNQGSFDSLAGKYLFVVAGGFSELLQVSL